MCHTFLFLIFAFSRSRFLRHFCSIDTSPEDNLSGPLDKLTSRDLTARESLSERDFLDDARQREFLRGTYLFECKIIHCYNAVVAVKLHRMFLNTEKERIFIGDDIIPCNPSVCCTFN